MLLYKAGIAFSFIIGPIDLNHYLNMSKARLQDTEMGEGMIISLVRDGCWNWLQNFASESYKKNSDPVYVFWRAFAQYNLGNTSGAINDLLSIKEKKEVGYASIVALLYYQNKARNIDRVHIVLVRNKSITFGLVRGRNAGVLVNVPCLTPFIFSFSSEK